MKTNIGQPAKQLIMNNISTVLVKLNIIRNAAINSTHERYVCEDYETPEEDLVETMKAFGLEEPEFISRDRKTVYIPVSMWNEAFGEGSGDTEEDFERIISSPEYKQIVELYMDVHDRISIIANEISAYYMRESEEENDYFHSIRNEHLM